MILFVASALICSIYHHLCHEKVVESFVEGCSLVNHVIFKHGNDKNIKEAQSNPCPHRTHADTGYL